MYIHNYINILYTYIHIYEYINIYVYIYIHIGEGRKDGRTVGDGAGVVDIHCFNHLLHCLCPLLLIDGRAC